MRWEGPDGEDGQDELALLVSNDPYRLGSVIGSGTRPRLDAGLLGIAAVAADTGAHRRALVPFGLRQWKRLRFVVAADAPVAAGIDGEAATLVPPIHFASRPRALRVRIARNHPGASPSARLPQGLAASVAGLVRIAVARSEDGGDIRRENERGDPMDSFEVEQRESLTRDEAATRLRRIANLLSGDGEEVNFDRGEMKFKVEIPDRVDWKVEFELDEEESELEIELKW